MIEGRQKRPSIFFGIFVILWMYEIQGPLYALSYAHP